MSRFVGPYRVEKHLGRGGLGDVFRARDDRLARTVALKLLPPAIARSAESRDRLFADAFVAATLAHPGIARLYDIGDHEGQPYLAFEFVEGRTLASRLAKGPLPVNEAVTLAIAIADALADAHRQGLPHRDLKPANVMISPRGRPKVLDFGLSGWTAGSLDRERVAADPMAAVAATRGTLEYLSPEQALGETGDARSDIFSLGVILYEMVTGRRPFNAVAPLDLLLAILKTGAPPPSRLNPAVPPALDAIVARCLCKSLDGRYQRASDVGDALREMAREPLPVTIAPPPRDVVRVVLPRGLMKRGALIAAVSVGLFATTAWLLAPEVRAAVSRLLH